MGDIGLECGYLFLDPVRLVLSKVWSSTRKDILSGTGPTTVFRFDCIFMASDLCLGTLN